MDAVEIKNKLKLEFNENVNSHVFLVETNNLDACLKDIKDIIKDKIQANAEVSKQIEDETYLETIIIRPEDKEIKKDQIMFLQQRLKTKPILSDYMFYIITPAETLSEISSNKLLKTIEEPNENIISFLITSNSDLILPTIKSRCEHINIMYDTSTFDTLEPDEDNLEVAKKIIYSIENKNHIEFSKVKTESINKDNHKIVENIIKDYYNMACNLTNYDYLDKNVLTFIKQNNNIKSLIQKAKYLNKTLNKLTENMNGDLLLEMIFLTLKEVK